MDPIRDALLEQAQKEERDKITELESRILELERWVQDRESYEREQAEYD